MPSTGGWLAEVNGGAMVTVPPTVSEPPLVFWIGAPISCM